jgi:hypothetical protein
VVLCASRSTKKAKSAQGFFINPLAFYPTRQGLNSMGFIPPYADRLIELARTNHYPTPMNCSFHVGSEDWQSNPENITSFARLLGLPVTVVPNAGHQLPKDYVSLLLENL